jgi:arylsulfatase A-like enzyme
MKKEASRAVILTGLMIASSTFFGCAKKAVIPRPDHIILIIVDALRPDHLGCYGYGRPTSPNIDRLAGRGARFENAYSNAPWTKPAVASIFTSLYPNVHQAINRFDVLSERALTLAERLKAGGYFTCLVNGGNALIHEFNYDQGFDYYAYSESLDSEAAVKRFESVLSEAGGKNLFVYVHLMDTHLPYHLNDLNRELAGSRSQDFWPGRLDRDSIRELTSSGTLSGQDRDYLISLYDEQIKYADARVGEIVSALESGGLLGGSLVVLTSDHGEEFWEHGNYEHGHSLYDEILRVPLVMAGPGVPPAELETRVRHVDLLPTIMEAADPGFRGEGIAGTSVWKYLKKDRGEQPVFASGTIHGDEKYGLIRGREKIIINTGEREKKRRLVGPHSGDQVEFYDLKRDRAEKNNLRFEKNKDLARMMKKIARLMDVRPLFQPGKRAIDKRTEERLKSLGYL